MEPKGNWSCYLWKNRGWDVCTWPLSSGMCCGWIQTFKGSNGFGAERYGHLEMVSKGKLKKGKEQIWRMPEVSEGAHGLQSPIPDTQRTWVCCWETVGTIFIIYLFNLYSPSLPCGQEEMSKQCRWSLRLSHLRHCYGLTLLWVSLCSSSWRQTVTPYANIMFLVLPNAEHIPLNSSHSYVSPCLILPTNFALKTQPSYLPFLLNAV